MKVLPLPWWRLEPRVARMTTQKFQRLDILFSISNLSYVLFVCLCTLRLKNPDWENQ